MSAAPPSKTIHPRKSEKPKQDIMKTTTTINPKISFTALCSYKMAFNVY